MKKLVKNSTPVFILLILVGELTAQQNSLFNTYALDPLQLNIAYAGAACTEANLHYRTQWIGLKEAPKVFQLNAHTALGKSNGLGLRVNSQSQGILNTLGATFGYSYRIKVSETAKVHLGLGVGLSQAALNSQKATVIDASDVTLNNNAKQTAFGFDSEFGAMYIGEKLKGGVSALHLYNSNPDFTGSSGYKALPQINTQVSYIFNKNKKLELEPMLLSRYTIGGSHVLDGFVNVHLAKMFTVGAGYRTNYGLMILLGAKLGHLRLGYSFDYGANKNAINLGTSHQLMLGFNFCRANKPKLDAEVQAPAAEQPTVLPTVVADLDPPKKEEVKPETIVPEKAVITPMAEEPISFEGVLKSGDNPSVPLKNKKVRLLNEKGEVIGESTTNNNGAFAFRNIPANQNFIVSVDEGNTALPEGTKVSLNSLSGKEVKSYYRTKESVNFKILSSEKEILNEMKADDSSLIMGINGFLYNQDDKPLANTHLTMKEVDGVKAQKIVTNQNGRFNFANLEADKNYIFEADENDPSLAGVSQIRITDSKGKTIRIIDLTKEKFSFKLLNADKNGLGDFKVEETMLEPVTKKEEVALAVDPAALEQAIVKMNHVAEEVIFDFNQSQLEEVGQKKIDNLAAIMNKHPELKINVTGHTCNIGSKEVNDLVSIRRATYVRNELINRGVNPKNINRSIGMGAEIELYNNADPKLQEKNRTVRFEQAR
jgi:type IX secretion system PorP/SprF family membrane protein